MIIAVIIAAALLGLAGLGASPGTVLAQPNELRTIVGFSEAEGDASVAAFVASYGLRVEALYLANNGFSGAHREYSDTPTTNLVAEARAQTIASFTNLLRGNDVRLKNFVDRHSEAELRANPAIATEGRSLLSIRSQAQGVLDAARAGRALVYAIEVRGSTPEQIAAISANPVVRAIRLSDGTSGGKGAARVKPSALEVDYHDVTVEALDGVAVRAAMVRLLEEGIR